MAESVADIVERIIANGHLCLNISHRGLSVLPEELAKIRHLRVLLLNDNELVLPPEEIMHLCSSLEELVLDGNKFTLLPSKLRDFILLKKLSLCRTPIGTLSPDIMRLSNLRELWLTECSLVTIPKEIGSLENLTRLGLRKNSLQTVPKQIANLKNLKWISIAENNLETLPSNLYLLSNLRYADLSCNKFQSVPPPLLDVKNLKVLVLSHNMIEAVSDDEILSMSDMVKVDLRCNMMKTKPVHWKGLEFILVGEFPVVTLNQL